MSDAEKAVNENKSPYVFSLRLAPKTPKKTRVKRYLRERRLT